MDFITGTLQMAAVILSVIAGGIALTMFEISKKELKAWRILIIVLILFAIEEIIGAFNNFGVFQNIYLRHVIPSLMLGLLVFALTVAIIDKNKLQGVKAR